MEQKKNGQHHVWKYYLDSWATDNRIYALIDSKKIVHQLTTQVGKKKHMYKVIPPTKEEHEFARKFYNIDNFSQDRKRAAEGWINIFELLYKAYELIENGLIYNKSDIDTIETMIVNSEENIHSSYESVAVQYFDMMNNDNFDFLSSDVSRGYFCYFIAIQYFRTLRNKNAIFRSIENESIKNALIKTWSYGKFIYSNLVGFNLYNNTITVYKNKTNLPLITSDQPAINLDAKYKKDGNPPDNFTLYYPVNPYLAIIFSEGVKTLVQKDLDDSFIVEKYNDLMHQWSENQTYASDVVLLKKYLKEG